MNKKVIGVIALICLLCTLLVGTIFFINGKSHEGKKSGNNTSSTIENKKEDENITKENDKVESDKKISAGKVLVVYFSATNNTKSVAEKIASNLNGDVFEIVPQDEYTSEDLDYNNSNSRVFKEHDNESLRNVKLKDASVDNRESYDTVLIGYPIWWGVAAWPVSSFVKSNNFDKKTVIPFCTSASSGLGQSGKLLENSANGGNWLGGHRFSSRPSDSDIKAFTDSIK